MLSKKRSSDNINYVSMLDLLTGALAAFVILYVIVNQKTSVEKNEQTEKLEIKVTELKKIINEQNQVLASLNQKVTEIEQTQKQVEDTKSENELSASPGHKFTLRNIHFYPGTSEIIYDSFEYLKEVADFLKQQNVSFLIEGHTHALASKCASDKANHDKVSLARSKAVYEAFIKYGISASRMRYDGMGCSKLVNPTAMTEAERTANRRVEIHIVK